MPVSLTKDDDARLVEVFMTPIRKCAEYKPAFGQGRSSGLVLREFKELYGADPFYAWLGLDTPAVYSAHKAAGGLTSVYRQIGVGSERLFRTVLGESLGLSTDQMDWSYTYDKGRGKPAVHTLDARIQASDLDSGERGIFEAWLKTARIAMAAANGNAPSTLTNGAAFEIRQGYKSADSKRQNADLRFGIHAYRAGLLPVFAIFSAQVSEPVLRRYRGDGMLVLTGMMSGDSTTSTFEFFRKVVGYDLAGFFQRNSTSLKAEIEKIVSKLLAV
jgi:hypothetical protein